MATKSRGYTGLIYMDSAPDDYEQQLSDSLGMFLLSPEHTPDPVEDLETGAIKTLKIHRHLMYMHGNTITPKAARDYLARFPWIVLPPSDRYFAVSSIRNLARYFCHLDQPDKQQFPGKPEDWLTVLNNFPLDLTRELTRADKREMKKQLFTYIRDNNVTEQNELIDALMDAGDWELFDFATDHSLMLSNYLWGVRKGGKRSNQQD